MYKTTKSQHLKLKRENKWDHHWHHYTTAKSNSLQISTSGMPVVETSVKLQLDPMQWRSETKCRPGPNIKVSPFPPHKFDKNFKRKKIIFRAYLNIYGLLKHLEDHNQTLTNWNGSCFSLSIILLSFCLSPPFLIITFPVFACFTYAYMDPTHFVKCSSLLVFSLWQDHRLFF